MPPMERDFYQILGITRQSSRQDILQAFRDLVRENHPDKFQDAARKRQAEETLKEITEAFNALYDPKRRENYDKSLDSQGAAHAVKSPQEQAKEFFQQGLARYRSGDLSAAVGLFDHVLRVQPDHSQALYYGGMVKLRNPKWRNAGAEAVEKAIALEPYNAEYVLEYCRLLLTMGQTMRAARILAKAAADNPASDEIKALLDRCSKPQEGAAGGKFSIFGGKK